MRLLILLCLVLVLPSTTYGQVTVERQGEENPMVTVAKSTLWGGLTGIVLGGAVALIAEENEEDIMKWFFVGGVFGGFAFGVYHVMTRPEPTALINFGGEGLAMRAPTTSLTRNTLDDGDGWTARITLVGVDF